MNKTEEYMNLNFILNNMDNLDTYLYLERYVNEGSRTYSTFSHLSEVHPKYQPKSNTKSFEVFVLEIPKEKVNIYLDNPNSDLLKYYINNNTVLFPIHPEVFADNNTAFIEELKKYPIKKLKVSPTASTRTVITIDNDVPCHFLKLHYPRRISRFIRSLGGNIIRKCVAISSDLTAISLPELKYLPESIGLVYGSGTSEWGFLVREFDSRPKNKQKFLRMPLFALYSQDLNHPNDLPLLIQVIKWLNIDPKYFIINFIMHPIIKIFCAVLNQRGIVLEMHGQNTLLEFDKNFSFSNIIYRDFDTYVDIHTRQRLNIDTNESLRRKRRIKNIFSVKYDAYIGHHLFDYIAKLAQKYYNIPPEELQAICKKLFYQYLPDSHFYFNEKTYYFSNELFANKSVKIIETNDPPRWR